MPLGSQQEVDLQAQKWRAEWDSDGLSPVLPWPAEMHNVTLPEVSLQVVRGTAFAFPANTGLGWDKFHPRALARCSDEALLALIRLFLPSEALSRWPVAVGIVVICELPKPDGGRRPIGLLPSVIRLWMRIRLDLIRSWQQDNDRP